MYSIRNKTAMFAAIIFAFLSPVYAVTNPFQAQTQKPDESSPPGSTGPAKSPDAKSPPRRVRVGGNVQSSKIITRVQPEYPRKAREQGIFGAVRLHVIIGTNGSVQEATVMSGDPLLADAAAEAVRQWKYKVSTIHGEPVEIETVVEITFSLAP